MKPIGLIGLRLSRITGPKSASSGSVARGRLAERTVPAVRPRARSRAFAAGHIRPFGAGHVHDMVNAGTAPAVSVHAYSPPLTAMRRYELTTAGLVHTSTERAELNW